MAVVIHDHENENDHDHDHENEQHKVRRRQRLVEKSRMKSSSLSISSPISRTILIPILIGCVLMAIGATFQSTQIIFNNNNNNININDGNSHDGNGGGGIGGIRRKTATATTTSITKSFIYPPPKYERNKYTFDSFIVGGNGNGNGNGNGDGGIDLAKFGFEDEYETNDNDDEDLSSSSSSATSNYDYELFNDFDLSSRIKGNESWIELLELRRDSISPSLSFYVDKVAYKRYLTTQYSILQIDNIKSFLLKYKYELQNDIQQQLIILRQKKKKQQKGDSSSSSSSTTAIIHNDDLSSLTALSYLSNEIERWLPKDKDYAAKPTHLSCSGGVWIIHNDISKQNNTITTYVGNGKKKMEPHYNNADNKENLSSITTIIANDISNNLNKVQEKCGRTVLESYALRNVKPGVVVEERFTQPSMIEDNEKDDESNENLNEENENENENLLLKGGMEFKVFTIWGRAWLTVWRPGLDGVQALLYRNGTNLIYEPPIKQKKKEKNKKNSNSTTTATTTTSTQSPTPTIVTKLPKWVDWERVIEIGEKLGRNKDMFRTDIFVGVTASSSTAAAAATSTAATKPIIRYVVSETEIHPTPLRGYEIIFNEAGRLWLAGYYYYNVNNNANINTNTNNNSVQQQQNVQHNKKKKNNKKFNINVIQNNEVPYGFYQ